MSGRAQDLPARLARTGLRSLEPVYRTITVLRNRSWDTRQDRVHRVSVPVISIGNLTTGGTGKTPLVRYVASRLLRQNQQPAIVSRGYGSQPGRPNDEFLELKMWLPDTPHLQNPDRVAAARVAIEEHRASVIVLDDGFQHRRLGRDLDIVLVDATCPFGYDHLLPRGLLREPVSSLQRADAVVVTRVNQVEGDEVERIRKRIVQHVAEDRIATVSFDPGPWLDLDGRQLVQKLDEPVIGFCGIGNPAGFRLSLDKLCSVIADFRSYPDHHHYTQADIDELQALAMSKQAKLICTVKDLVKVRELDRGPATVLAATIKTRFQSGELMLQNMIALPSMYKPGPKA